MKEVSDLYECPVCGFRYESEETAKKCEAWCREYSSCNLEIIKEAIAPPSSSSWRTTEGQGNKMDFKERVLKVVRKIPPGKTLTYKEVAQLAGSPRAYRAVGNILRRNYNLEIPCHRVIRSNGEIGKYNRGREKKIQFLKTERAVIQAPNLYLAVGLRGNQR